jgi:hypothetical protein
MKRRPIPIFAWLTIAAAVCFVVQLIPGVGFLATSFGAHLGVGVLLLLAMIALFVEALVGRVRRWLVTVPLVFFSAYYAVLAYEHLRLPDIASELGTTAENGGLRFEPARHALAPHLRSANELLVRYNIEWIYNPLEGTRSTVGRTMTCEPISYITGVKDETNPVGIHIDSLYNSFCFSSENAVAPADTVITLEKRESTPLVAGIIPTKVQTLIARLGSNEVGRTSVVDAEVLSPIPMFVAGCGMTPKPAGGFDCIATFVRRSVKVLPPRPHDTGRRVYDTEREAAQIAKLLSLTPRTPEQIEAIARNPPS